MNRTTFTSIVLLLCASVASAAPPTSQPASSPLSTLRPQHPRLLVLDDQLDAVRSAIATDPLAKSLHDRMTREATALLAVPPCVYTIGGPEHTLLAISRTVEGRVMLLAGLYRLDHDKRFADRAIAEMRAAAGFVDWYPKHFLDTAEMTAALGIGYDWCFDALSDADRTAIRQAIIDKGLDPGIERMAPGGFLPTRRNNWMQVCYGGLTLGALAIAEDEPKRADEVITHSIEDMTQIMKLFAPDGGFEEGPVYWNYATTFNTYYLAALETALGSDLGVDKAPGFANTGDYRMQTISPLRMYANFGDCDTEVGYATQMFWLARHFNKPMYAMAERDLDANPKSVTKSPGILELLWQYPLMKPDAAAAVPTAQSFERINAAFIRSSWTDPAATYLAFKGGDARASHGHLDLGHFIAEMAGQRWAIDPAGDSYGLPGYFGKQRFDYFRLRTEGHNTLTVEDTNESLKAKAPLKLLGTGAAIVDLSECYPDSFHDWHRGAALRGVDRIIIQDELQPLHPAHIIWHFHTRATVKLNGNTAELSHGGAAVRLIIDSPSNAVFTLKDDSKPAEPNSPNPNLVDVQIDLNAADQATTIAVEMVHGNGGGMAVKPLKDWTGVETN